MIDFKNKIYIGSANRKSLFDCRIPEGAKAVIIFMHGYKGYKDWGAWDLMCEAFVNDGFGYIKFNTSHNGGTTDNPIDFDDLKAFGENRYSYELNDLKIITDETERIIQQELELDLPIYLLGHSRGGGVSILGASKDLRIKKIISLAGISSIADRWPDEDGLKEWEEEGVMYVQNGRTNQNMPHYYSFYEDFLEHKDALDIQAAAESLAIPFLQIHGDMDQAVSIREGQELAKWTNTRISIIKGAEHTFGTKQPWDEAELPSDMKRVLERVLEFYNS